MSAGAPETQIDRRAGSQLPVPLGWFAVAHSDEIPAGEVRTLRYFATEFVVWRGDSGELNATDAYCRHLGAHMGAGKVVGELLECPFHHWRYTGQGAVAEIPYSRSIPPQVRRPCIKVWPVAEANGLVYVWHHPQGAAPLWEVEALFPDGEDWKLHARHEWTVKVHIQEINENGVDYPHFVSVHGTKSMPEPQWKIDGIYRRSVSTAKMQTPRGIVDGTIDSRAIGPGQASVRFTGISDVLLLNSMTPIDRFTTQARFDFYYPARLEGSAERVAAAVARDVVGQFDQDIPIWESKRYEPDPILCAGDGPILHYRRQYAQYYVAD